MNARKLCIVFALNAALFGTVTAPPAVGQTEAEAEATPEASVDASSDTLLHFGSDPIERLEVALQQGRITLEHDTLLGHLPSLLETLDIPVSSQTLIFSRTSLQTQGIAPWAPRGVYFNDDVYVGYVQESSFLEIASVHPTEGGVFYTLGQAPAAPPSFQRETTSCLMCHESRTTTGGVPGFIMRSVLTDRLGYVITDVHSGPTTDRTPMEERWGGWYVTGNHGESPHAGNTKAPELSHEVSNTRTYLSQFDMGTAGNLSELKDRFDPTPYPSPHSDIVALMVLTHQVQVHNYIALTHSSTREALRDQNAALLSGRAELDADSLSATARVRIDGAAARLVREMLLARASPLPNPVSGTSDFAEEWSARGPFDQQGRSLRDLDLESRLFRYPLSFLIYSDAFRALPDLVRARVYQGIAAVLTGANQHEDYAHLSEADRTAILEILLDTVPEFSAYVEA